MSEVQSLCLTSQCLQQSQNQTKTTTSFLAKPNIIDLGFGYATGRSTRWAAEKMLHIPEALEAKISIYPSSHEEKLEKPGENHQY